MMKTALSYIDYLYHIKFSALKPVGRLELAAICHCLASFANSSVEVIIDNYYYYANLPQWLPWSAAHVATLLSQSCL